MNEDTAGSALSWTRPGSPRIWRHRDSNVENDEPLHAAAVYTDAGLERIATEGFTGIWLFGLLYDLMDSHVFPELNQRLVAERLASIQTVVQRAQQHGLGVWLYFNEPMGIASDHVFWRNHPEIRGEKQWQKYALCPSAPLVETFLADAIASVFRTLQDVAGVLLITAGEDVTHCWAKRDVRHGDTPPGCPRCRDREPADIVLRQIQTWADVSRRQSTPFRVLAWNWEWAHWYPDPPAPIIDRLPAGVELLLDLEFGGTRLWRGRPIPVGEYSLGYVGPGDRFVVSRAHARRRGIPVHAKIEINVSHELASVPNLPLLANVHGKLKALVEQGVAGFLGCWVTSSTLTVNSYAVRLFLQDPHRYLDAETFLDALGREYFGLRDTLRVQRAWVRFGQAFQEYPFSTAMLYSGPQNDAPARPLSLHYRGQPAPAAFRPGPFGDDLSRCFGKIQQSDNPFTPAEIVSGFSRLRDLWIAALPDYEAGLADDEPQSDEQQRHRREELDCARMLGIQLASTANALAFFLALRARCAALRLTPPCAVPATPELLTLMREELANTEHALPLVERDPRLGFHQAYQGYKYDARLIREKLAAMRSELVRIESRS